MSDQAFVRRQRGYPGRERLDASSMRFRAAVSRLAREAERDPNLAAELAPIVDAACAAWDDLTRRADLAAAKSERHQARLQRQIIQCERQLRAAPPQLRPHVERELDHLRTLLADHGTAG